MGKDKEAAMARQQEVFEAALQKTSQERSQSGDEPEQHSASASPALQMLPQSHLADQQTGGWARITRFAVSLHSFDMF